MVDDNYIEFIALRSTTTEQWAFFILGDERMRDLEPRVSEVIDGYNICDLAYMYVNLEQQNAKLLAIVKECKQELNELNYGGYESTDKLVGKIEQTLAEIERLKKP